VVTDPVRCRPALTKLLAVLLLLQWGTAFAHCLRLAAPMEGLTVEICTADGVHRIVMPVERDEEGDHGGHAAIPPCPACLGPAAPALTPPPVVLAPPLLLAQAADPPAPRPAPPAPSPAPSCQPRAPPTS
jgi:hypothetical protein